MKRKVPIWIALPIILAVGGSLYSLVNTRAEASTLKQAKVWSNEDCLKCHTNKKVLSRMQDKRGDPTYCQAAYDKLIKLQDEDQKTTYGK